LNFIDSLHGFLVVFAAAQAGRSVLSSCGGNMRFFLASVVLLLTCADSFGQEPKPKSETIEQSIILILPRSEVRPYPVPELSLQHALKFAKAYLRKQGAKISQLHLIAAEFTFAGAEKNPPPCWRFRWRKQGSVNDRGFDDDIYVFMDGRVWNPPEL
jgi:hypothetical protein